jgi:hypothetical protein
MMTMERRITMMKKRGVQNKMENLEKDKSLKKKKKMRRTMMTRKMESLQIKERSDEQQFLKFQKLWKNFEA